MSFELFVRPFIEPPIRPPAKPPVLPFQDTPEQGVAVLRGLGGKLIDLTFSVTQSWSKSKATEVERTVTRQRVYQKEKNPATGKEEVNKENYVDVEHVTKMKMQEGNGTLRYEYYTEPPESPNIETLEVNVTIPNPDAPPPEPVSGGAAP